ncbi:MAG: hypothetical protein HYZ53_28820 [Planctomycetes bacterium]|nr:hypothetical protein [Planctomycetota bacterium]
MESGSGKQLAVVLSLLPVLAYFVWDAWAQWERSPMRAAARAAAAQAESQGARGTGPTATPGAPAAESVALPAIEVAGGGEAGVRIGDLLPAVQRQRERVRAELRRESPALPASDAAGRIDLALAKCLTADGVTSRARSGWQETPDTAGRVLVRTQDFTLVGTESALASVLSGVLELEPGAVMIEDLVVRPEQPGAAGPLLADLRIVAAFRKP